MSGTLVFSRGGIGVEEVRDLRELNVLQEHYLEMQGLRKVPIGLFVLFVCGLQVEELASWWPSLEAWMPYVGITVFGVAVWCFWSIGGYYERNFGLTLESSPTKNREALVWSCVLASMMFTLAEIEPISPANLAAGVAMSWIVVSYFLTGKLWPHASVLMALVMTMFQIQIIESSFPLWGFTLTLLAMLGVVLAWGGVFSHSQLVKTLGPVPEDE